MQNRARRQKALGKAGHGRTLTIRSVILAIVALGLAGCSAVPVYQQELVSSYGMVFSDSPVLMAEPALLTQIEPGVASTGGGQAAGCSSCR